MTITTVAIACDVGLPDNSEFTASRLDFTLSGPDYDTLSNDSIPAVTVSVSLNASGVGTANLWPVDRGTRNTHYVVSLYGAVTVNGTSVAKSYDLGIITPPEAGTPDLANLLAQSNGGVYAGSTIYESIAAAVAAAVESAGDAAGYAASAELAAMAAGAPIVTALTSPTPANGTIELLKVDAGLIVYQVVAGSWSLVGWLQGPDFKTVADLLASTAANLGATGGIVNAGGFRYQIVTSGQHLTTAGGVKLYVVNAGQGASIDALGALGNGTASDSAAFAAAALIGGKWALRDGANYRVANVTLAANGLAFSCAGVCNITKNANGPIFSGPATDMNFTGIIFRGGPSSNSGLTGHNLDFTGARNVMTRCGSMWAHGRAVKSAAKISILAPIAAFQTDDVSATGYDIEIGNSVTSTSYAAIQDVVTSQSTGGFLFINPGVVFVSGCQFGKLTTQNIGSPAGIGGGSIIGNRITGNLSLGVSNAVITGNLISAVQCTVEAGTTGIQLENIHAIGSTVINNASPGVNHIVRLENGRTSNQGLSSNGQTRVYGSDAQQTAMVVRETGSFEFYSDLYVPGLQLPNLGALRLRSSGGTNYNALLMDASGNVIFGHPSTGGYAILHGGTSTYFNVGGSSILQAYSTGFRPVADNAITLGTSGQAWQDVQAHKITTRPKTVATLPVGAAGARSFVTDSTVVAAGNFGAIVAGGGANGVPVYHDGTNWRIG